MTDPSQLNNLVEFDRPFLVSEGTVKDAPRDVWAPPVWHVDGQRGPEIEGNGWSFVDGYSGQDRYSGPVMHASEFLGGRMARDVLAESGIYVLCVVEDMDDMDNPAGWVLLKRD